MLKAYTLEGLTYDDDQPQFVWPEDVNSNAVAVGTVQAWPFMWRSNGGMTSLGVLPGTEEGGAYAINEKEEIVGYCQVELDPPTEQAFIPFHWSASTGMKQLADLTGYIAVDINESGVIICHSVPGPHDGPDEISSLRLYQGAKEFLTPLPGKHGTRAVRINAGGTILGHSGDVPTVWDNPDVPRALTVNGVQMDSGIDLNKEGHVLGSFQGQNVVRRTETEVLLIPSPPGLEDVQMQSLKNGDVVLANSATAGPMVFSEKSGWVPMIDSTPSQGQYPGPNDFFATRMNAKGQIVGFVWVLKPQAPAESDQLGFLATPSLVLGGPGHVLPPVVYRLTQTVWPPTPKPDPTRSRLLRGTMEKCVLLASAWELSDPLVRHSVIEKVGEAALLDLRALKEPAELDRLSSVRTLSGTPPSPSWKRLTAISGQAMGRCPLELRETLDAIAVACDAGRLVDGDARREAQGAALRVASTRLELFLRRAR